ncbi:putative transcription factor C2H2 family [Helianthus anomalus]
MDTSSSTTPRPMSSPSKNKSKSAICRVCKRDLCHEKALNGHIRWHTQEEREAAGIGNAKVVASASIVIGDADVPKSPESSKPFKLPDLNKSPPREEDKDAA